jgi:hypothetical protein
VLFVYLVCCQARTPNFTTRFPFAFICIISCLSRVRAALPCPSFNTPPSPLPPPLTPPLPLPPPPLQIPVYGLPTADKNSKDGDPFYKMRM